ncbi:hypothetical protein BU14_0334s0006 [Porphyra umbilicalis]|uniref:DUF1015 domain-containing protein n=1 Tax=Porphyra umbilicalis TaxID=2786 RepID=A0A1X6NYI7_PORUM|nr:hypothetical protein BU14_0334s0006 [Porphyra umbilicalis]|eukprot:OSX73605.1 hypothetical protein BU14_0334s0006 [Porphyra umbilicalis]
MPPALVLPQPIARPLSLSFLHSPGRSCWCPSRLPLHSFPPPLCSPAVAATMRVRPFAAVRPADSAAAGRVACPPYDVVSASEAIAAAAAAPDTFLRVVLPECGLPDGGTGAPAAARHEAAAAALARLTTDGLLVRERTPALYVYELRVADGGGGGDHAQRGLVATVSVRDYATGVIRVHEDTRAVKEAERAALTDALSAHTGPVFLTHPDGGGVGGTGADAAGGGGAAPGGVTAALDAAVAGAGPPLFSFTADDACGPVTHTVWRVDGAAADALGGVYAACVPAAYVADGHHRAASAASVGAARAAVDGAPTAADGEVEAAWFLAALFPVSHMRLLPYHRVVRDLPGGTDADAFLARLSAVCDVAPASADAAAAAAAAPAWYRVTLPAAAAAGGGGGGGGDAGPAAALDCARLQDTVLGPLLGVTAPRTDPRMEFVGGDAGVPGLVAAVDAADKAAAGVAAGGGAAASSAVAFAMAPVALDDLLAVSDAGARMPPKSTWFSPKLRSGLFVHPF